MVGGAVGQPVMFPGQQLAFGVFNIGRSITQCRFTDARTGARQRSRKRRIITGHNVLWTPARHSQQRRAIGKALPPPVIGVQFEERPELVEERRIQRVVADGLKQTRQGHIQLGGQRSSPGSSAGARATP